MKKFNSGLIVLLFVTFLSLIAFDPSFALSNTLDVTGYKNDSDILSPTAVIPVSGNISSDTTWTNGNVYYVNDDVSVLFGVNLTIEPGAIVKFDQYKKFFIDGKLTAVGTSGSPIYFTSYRDDSVGGDTNGDGSSVGQEGDWTWLEFHSGSDDTSVIDYAVLRYGGNQASGMDYGIIYLQDASPTIQNSTISHSFTDGIYMESTLTPGGSSPTISSNNFANSNSACVSMDPISSPSLSGNACSNNGSNGLEVRGGSISSSTAWDQTDMTYRVIDDVTVGNSTTLTIGAGMVLKFDQYKKFFIDGKLTAVGTSGSPIYFTSYRDDSVGGDTNGDGSSVGQEGDWTWLEFHSGSDDTSVIDYAVLRYGGNQASGTDYGIIYLQDASPTIQNSTISHSFTDGIYAEGSTPILQCNDITNNNSLGIQNASAATVIDATNHFWGSPSGPYHPVTNPSGTGNGVSDGVNFVPWRTLSCFETVVFLYLPSILNNK
ncbi:right-handed parallel beta-helix repeat-containing protein [Chloroflexota bacterium]